MSIIVNDIIILEMYNIIKNKSDLQSTGLSQIYRIV